MLTHFPRVIFLIPNKPPPITRRLLVDLRPTKKRNRFSEGEMNRRFLGQPLGRFVARQSALAYVF